MAAFTLVCGRGIQQFSCRQTRAGTLHATSLQDFGYGDVVHQVEKRCKEILALIIIDIMPR